MKTLLDASNFQSTEGLLVVALPNTTLPVLTAIARKTGMPMPNIIALGLQNLLAKVLNKDELAALAQEIRSIKDP